MYKFKDKNLRGQAASTHAQNLIARVEAKKDAAVEKYKCDHTQGTRMISWIWLVTDGDTSPSESDHVQDCHWWHQRATLHSLVKTSEQEGLQAYAHHQAALHSAMWNSFQAHWSFIAQLNPTPAVPVPVPNDDSGPSIDAPPVVVDF
ncbi:hypothetical protein DFJ58DRAFT_841788 [Suillus subalutaceus]|uniref:uncharacterized protein n=1 Tax=Suillus subalutaceus TaxID=48586 RepID=UPI001B87E94C|nr:uncharacterized protein DFJ58DRAFT_841788 [Suillus subalutaceus]KAG1852752.1 hypothetical protein DFJ58DRAFT_841788 [Suillus subalutaceus]